MASDAVADPIREQRSLSSALRWVSVVCLFAGAVLYSNWLLEIVFRREADPDLFISELAALDQPYGAWFRWGDRLTAIVVIVAVVIGLTVMKNSRWSTVGWSLLGIFAVGTALDSTVWNMGCAEHLEPECRIEEASSAGAIGEQLHLLSSTIAVVAAIFSMMVFFAADFTDPTPPRVRRGGLFVLAGLIATAVWMGLAVSVDSADRSGEVGISQRAYLAATACWLIYVGLRTARGPTKNMS